MRLRSGSAPGPFVCGVRASLALDGAAGVLGAGIGSSLMHVWIRLFHLPKLPSRAANESP